MAEPTFNRRVLNLDFNNFKLQWEQGAIPVGLDGSPLKNLAWLLVGFNVEKLSYPDASLYTRGDLDQGYRNMFPGDGRWPSRVANQVQLGLTQLLQAWPLISPGGRLFLQAAQQWAALITKDEFPEGPCLAYACMSGWTVLHAAHTWFCDGTGKPPSEGHLAHVLHGLRYLREYLIQEQLYPSDAEFHTHTSSIAEASGSSGSSGVMASAVSDTDLGNNAWSRYLPGQATADYITTDGAVTVEEVSKSSGVLEPSRLERVLTKTAAANLDLLKVTFAAVGINVSCNGYGLYRGCTLTHMRVDIQEMREWTSWSSDRDPALDFEQFFWYNEPYAFYIQQQLQFFWVFTRDPTAGYLVWKIPGDPCIKDGHLNFKVSDRSRGKEKLRVKPDSVHEFVFKQAVVSRPHGATFPPLVLAAYLESPNTHNPEGNPRQLHLLHCSHVPDSVRIAVGGMQQPEPS